VTSRPDHKNTSLIKESSQRVREAAGLRDLVARFKTGNGYT